LDWIAPVFDGGSPVIDYRVWYDNANDDWQVFDEGITDTSYTALGLL
jgi:hypothetical protein